MNFILALAIIITAAKLGGYLSTRLGQPSVLGELLAGLILGPTVLDMLHVWPMFSADTHLGETITFMAELGVLLLMMLAGLELHLSELLKSGKVAAFAGVFGVIVPLGVGSGVALLFGATSSDALFIGLTLAATSVSISAQTLMELNVLQSRVGLGLLGAAVFDDVLVILILSISLILVGGGGAGLMGVIITILSMAGYLIVASMIGLWVLPRLTYWIDRLPISHGTLAFSLISCLLFAWSAEVVGGMAAITGAFLVGLYLSRTPFKARIESGLSALAYGFFVPIFFVNIGLEVNMRTINGEYLWIALVILLVAILTKLIGGGLGAKLGGFTSRQSLQLGLGMISRGEVGLIIASFALAEGLLSAEYFSVVVFMVIGTTLVTPPLLRASFKSPSPSGTTT